LKVFTAIHKRLYRSLTKEYEKLFKLNRLYFDKDQMTYFLLNSSGAPEEAQIMGNDYTDSVTVKPNADPNVVSDAQELARAEALMQMVPMGTINPQEATKRILEAMKQPDIPTLMKVEPPGPSEKEMEMQGKAQIEQMKSDTKKEIEAMKAQLKEQESRFKAEMDMMSKQQDMAMREQEHRLEMRHAQEQHQLKMAIQEREAQMKRMQQIMLFQEHQRQQKEKKAESASSE
ncbi:MAG: hypothetical protein WDZ61_00330, partial [Parcubacteria group bacterium]